MSIDVEDAIIDFGRSRELRVQIGRIARDRRIELGITATSIAQSVGHDKNTVIYWEATGVARRMRRAVCHAWEDRLGFERGWFENFRLEAVRMDVDQVRRRPIDSPVWPHVIHSEGVVDFGPSRSLRILLGRRTKDRRLEIGTTVLDVASALCVNRVTFSTWEKAVPRRMPLSKCDAWEDQLKVERGWLSSFRLPPGKSAHELVVENISAMPAPSPGVQIDEPLRSVIGARARNRRIELCISRPVIAAQLAISVDTLQAWEKYRTPASLDAGLLDRWSRALEMSLEDLMRPGPSDTSSSQVDACADVPDARARVWSRVRTRLTELNLSLAQFATRISSSPSIVGRWSARCALPERLDRALVERIEVALEVPCGWLLADIPERSKTESQVAATRLFARCKELDIKLGTLAALCGMSEAMLRIWHGNREIPVTVSSEHIQRLETAIGVSAGWLFRQSVTSRKGT